MPDPTDLDVSRETFERLAAFHSLLLTWNARINLIGRHEQGQIWQRHIADSLSLVTVLPATGSIVDLGSGAGFPGLVVAIATGRPTTLIEADQRKAAFLQECGRLTDTTVTVIAERIEKSGVKDAEIVSARALARLPRLLALTAPILAGTGVCLFLKGLQVDAELTEARQQWQMSVTSHTGRAASGGCILEVRHLRPLDAVAR